MVQAVLIGEWCTFRLQHLTETCEAIYLLCLCTSFVADAAPSHNDYDKLGKARQIIFYPLLGNSLPHNQYHN